MRCCYRYLPRRSSICPCVHRTQIVGEALVVHLFYHGTTNLSAAGSPTNGTANLTVPYKFFRVRPTFDRFSALTPTVRPICHFYQHPTNTSTQTTTTSPTKTQPHTLMSTNTPPINSPLHIISTRDHASDPLSIPNY